jgi:hypothetical protein
MSLRSGAGLRGTAALTSTTTALCLQSPGLCQTRSGLCCPPSMTAFRPALSISPDST